MLARIESLTLSIGRWTFVGFASLAALCAAAAQISSAVPLKNRLFGIPFAGLLTITGAYFVRPRAKRSRAAVSCPRCGASDHTVRSPVNQRHLRPFSWCIFGATVTTLWVEGRRSRYDCAACGHSFERRSFGQRLAFTWLIFWIAAFALGLACDDFSL